MTFSEPVIRDVGGGGEVRGRLQLLLPATPNPIQSNVTETNVNDKARLTSPNRPPLLDTWCSATQLFG